MKGRLGFRTPISPDDPRLRGHETVYKGSRGGWVKDDDEKPVAGESQHDGDERGRRWR
jgi:hypothetical protein